MDEPVPIRRAAIGCLALALAVAAFGLLIRPAIFSLAPARDDSAITVATALEVASGPIQRDVILARSRGWSGEVAAGDGRVQLSVIVAPAPVSGVTAFNAASPGRDGCPVQIDETRLTDCAGRAWTLEGAPVDPADAPLERIPAVIDAGSVVLDLSRPAGE
jgi:hypothetical protein